MLTLYYVANKNTIQNVHAVLKENKIQTVKTAISAPYLLSEKTNTENKSHLISTYNGAWPRLNLTDQILHVCW